MPHCRPLTLVAIPLALLALTPAAGATEEGFYIAIGVGGAVASGDRGVPLRPGGVTVTAPVGSPTYDEVIRTDFGGGMALELRFGYLVGGLIAPEISLGGHGSLDAEAGAAYPSFVLRYHPAQHAIDFSERRWDVNVYAGVGYAIGGYHPDPAIDPDGKGWEGLAILTGVGLSWQVDDAVSLGVDVRFALPQYSSFIFNWDRDLRAKPDGTPSTLVVMPTAQVIFHL